MSYPSQQVISDVSSMLAQGNHEDALRLSGEELARADNRWRCLHNDHADRTDVIAALEKMMNLAALHSACLRRADMAADAFGTAVAALTSATFEDALDQTVTTALTLADSAMADLQHLAGQIPDDEHTRRHLPVIITYLASVEYALYRTAIAAGTSGPVVNSAYTTLKSLMHTDAVRARLSVPVDTDPNENIEVDPLHPLPAMLDLMARAAALGILDQ